MTAKEVIEKCAKLGVEEQRELSDEYAELVFYNEDLEEWSEVLTQVLGPPAKPAGIRPTPDDLRLSEDYGGIHDNQTLFKKKFAELTVIAMFWPWQDKVHTTLKVALVKE